MQRLPNVTRESPSIPRRLLREGKPHLIPVYALMLTSELGREGIERSGSFRFADHVYRNVPRGRFGIGWLLDAALLRLPAARSMRSRYFHSRDAIVAEVRARAAAGAREVRIVSAPCGIAREMVDASDAIARDPALSTVRVHFHGIDLDPEPLALSRELAGDRPGFTFASGDVFDLRAYPPDTDVIVSTGLVDFLDDESATRFFSTCHAALRAGGVLVTSAQQPQPLADYLMRELAELRPVYRGPAEISDVVRRGGFDDVLARPDAVGLQTLVTARKAGTS